MEKYLKILKECSLFDEIEDNDLMRMLSCLGARVELFDKKYTVFAEGSPARYIGIVLSGSVQTVYVDYYGNRNILSVSCARELVAEAFACAGADEIPVSVIADEPSEIMLIDCSHILCTCKNVCGFHQKLIFNLMRTLAQKNISFHQKIEIISKRSTRDKLLAYLEIQARISGSGKITVPFDRQELADYLGVERSGLSSEISKMKQEKIIDNYKNHFELL